MRGTNGSVFSKTIIITVILGVMFAFGMPAFLKTLSSSNDSPFDSYVYNVNYRTRVKLIYNYASDQLLNGQHVNADQLREELNKQDDWAEVLNVKDATVNYTYLKVSDDLNKKTFTIHEVKYTLEVEGTTQDVVYKPNKTILVGNVIKLSTF